MTLPLSYLYMIWLFGRTSFENLLKSRRCFILTYSSVFSSFTSSKNVCGLEEPAQALQNFAMISYSFIFSLQFMGIKEGNVRAAPQIGGMLRLRQQAVLTDPVNGDLTG